MRGLVFGAVGAGLLIAALWYWSFASESIAPVQLALKTATGSHEVSNSLGGERIKKRYVTGHIISGADWGNADLTINVAGASGKGTLIEWAQNGFGGWHICSLVFKDSLGKETTVVSDDTTNCDRE